ncbi:MAG: hypothetical protein LBH08_01655 [Puniceicoccales bacterium]|jgi:type III secretion protein C|nr:hypothetical protein [Puniceicoccales bacterium]
MKKIGYVICGMAILQLIYVFWNHKIPLIYAGLQEPQSPVVRRKKGNDPRVLHIVNGPSTGKRKVVKKTFDAEKKSEPGDLKISTNTEEGLVQTAAKNQRSEFFTDSSSKYATERTDRATVTPVVEKKPEPGDLKISTNTEEGLVQTAAKNQRSEFFTDSVAQSAVGLFNRTPAIPTANNEASGQTTRETTREVIGDSGRPLINLDTISTINSITFVEGDPANCIPWKTSEYYHFAKNQELKELVRNFCAAQSMDVVISDSIGDIVNGKFSNISPKQFWKDIVNAYGLVWFFDGSMMYVYKSSEVTSAVYQMSRDEMRTLVKVIAQLGWLSSNVTFRPMETAEILVVSGPPKLMLLLEELSRKVVVERVSDVYNIRSFPLKHAWAYDMAVNYRGGTMNVPGVASMLQQIIGEIPVPIGDSKLGVSIDNSKSNEATEKKAIPGTVYHTNESKKKNNEENNKNSDKNDEKNPTNLGKTFITYDTRLNAVIVKAKRQDMSFIEDIIQQLDVPRDAIKIDIAVVDITKSGAMKIGSKFAVNKRDTNPKSSESTAQKGNMERISFDFIDQTTASVTMNFDKLFRNYSLAQTLNILEDVGNAQTLTRSSVITLDNIGAVIDRSNTVYMPVTGAKAGGLFNVTVSTKLIVIPHIVPGEFDCNGFAKIKLLIEVSDGTFDKSPLVTTTGPSTATNSVNTEASLFEGQSLFIGGYFHENHSRSSAGIPFLKDIPLLGYLFKTDNRDDSVMERIYIITPSIISIDDPRKKQLSRFFTDGQLAGEPTLKPDEFILTHDYERPSFDNATFEINEPKRTWGKLLSKKEKDTDSSETKRTTQHKKRIRNRRR